MKRAFFWVLIIGLIISFGMVGCAKKDETKEIKIGIVLPLSGPAAGHGEDILGGINLAMEEANLAGSINGKKIELVIEDNQSTPQGSVSALRKLINIQKLPVIIGPVASGNMLAMAPIAEKAKIVLISPAASSPKISDAGDYIFRNSLLAAPQGEMMAKFCYETLQKKKVAILFIDDETGRGYKESFESKIISLGGKVVFVDKYDKRGTDFRAQLSKLKQNLPEAVYVPSIPKTLGHILRQAKELGIKAVFLANYGAEGETLLKTAGETANGIYYTSIPIDSNFIDKFEKVHGRKPTIGAPLGYDTLKLTALAIGIGGYSAEGIKKELYGIHDFSGVTGRISFDEKGDAMKEVIVKTVRNGSFVNYK